MSNTNTGGPAFPRNISYPHESGMTLRDYFAAKAMQGLLASTVATPQEFANQAYLISDAMLEARQS